jgi:hypothetical protein
MKNVVFWDVTPLGFCNNRRFGGTFRRHHLSTLMEMIRPSEMSVLTIAARPHIPDDDILRAHEPLGSIKTAGNMSVSAAILHGLIGYVTFDSMELEWLVFTSSTACAG